MGTDLSDFYRKTPFRHHAGKAFFHLPDEALQNEIVAYFVLFQFRLYVFL